MLDPGVSAFSASRSGAITVFRDEKSLTSAKLHLTTSRDEELVTAYSVQTPSLLLSNVASLVITQCVVKVTEVVLICQ